MKPERYTKFAVISILAIVVGGFAYKNITKKNSEKSLNANHVGSSLQSSKPSRFTPSDDIDFSSILDNSSFVKTVDERLRLISSRDDLSAYDAEQILAAVNDPRVWDFSEKASPDDLPLDDSEKDDGRTFFRASPARVAISIPGDILEVSLPDLDEPLLLEVEKVGSPGNGVVSLMGRVKGISGTFNMTQGRNLVAGHINTSTNTYSFEMFGETGWIHESGALFTGELPPIVDSELGGHETHSTLGSKGERIIAKGNGAVNEGLETKHLNTKNKNVEAEE